MSADEKNMSTSKDADLITSAALPDVEEQAQYAEKDVQVDVHTHICEFSMPIPSFRVCVCC